MATTYSYTVITIGLKDLNKIDLVTVNRTATANTSNTEGKSLYNEINNETRVRTGRLKRGNWLEINEFGFHYWNNVPYSKYMDTWSQRGNRFITGPFERRKAGIIRRFDDEVKKALATQIASIKRV